jgi:hypothetical protein
LFSHVPSQEADEPVSVLASGCVAELGEHAQVLIGIDNADVSEHCSMRGQAAVAILHELEEAEPGAESAAPENEMSEPGDVPGHQRL